MTFKIQLYRVDNHGWGKNSKQSRKMSWRNHGSVKFYENRGLW